MPQVSVDIDLYEIKTDDLIEELRDRVGRLGNKGMDEKQIEQFAKLIKKGLNGQDVPSPLPISTLDDQMKLDHLIKVWGKYTSAQVESALPQF